VQPRQKLMDIRSRGVGQWELSEEEMCVLQLTHQQNLLAQDKEPAQFLHSQLSDEAWAWIRTAYQQHQIAEIEYERAVIKTIAKGSLSLQDVLSDAPSDPKEENLFEIGTELFSSLPMKGFQKALFCLDIVFCQGSSPMYLEHLLLGGTLAWRLAREAGVLSDQLFYLDWALQYWQHAILIEGISSSDEHFQQALDACCDIVRLSDSPQKRQEALALAIKLTRHVLESNKRQQKLQGKELSDANKMRQRQLSAIYELEGSVTSLELCRIGEKVLFLCKKVEEDGKAFAGVEVADLQLLACYCHTEVLRIKDVQKGSAEWIETLSALYQIYVRMIGDGKNIRFNPFIQFICTVSFSLIKCMSKGSEESKESREARLGCCRSFVEWLSILADNKELVAKTPLSWFLNASQLAMKFVQESPHKEQKFKFLFAAWTFLKIVVQADNKSQDNLTVAKRIEASREFYTVAQRLVNYFGTSSKSSKLIGVTKEVFKSFCQSLPPGVKVDKDLEEAFKSL